jgi:uncharacterized membrane protein
MVFRGLLWNGGVLLRARGSFLVSLAKPDAIYLLAGTLLYLVGTILVTIIFNVPLNDALAAVDPTTADASGFWTTYVKSWTAWNHVRTVAALAAAASFITALCH